MSYKEVQKRKNLTSRVLQIQVNRFIENISNQIIMPSRPIRAIVNKNGFIEVLNGAKKSNDSETLESIMPKELLGKMEDLVFSFGYILKKQEVEKLFIIFLKKVELLTNLPHQ